MGEDQDDADGDECDERGVTLCHDLRRKHALCQSGLFDNVKSRVLEWRSLSRFVGVAHGLLVSLTIHGGFYGYDGTCGAG